MLVYASSSGFAEYCWLSYCKFMLNLFHINNFYLPKTFVKFQLLYKAIDSYSVKSFFKK
jgi:hypothetical protein